MKVINEIAPLRAQILLFRREGLRIAFVPTMGHIHEGHLALIRKARDKADAVVVSIFVNPLQFEKPDELANYPRSLDEDLAKLKAEGVHLVFTPSVEQMYPHGLEHHTCVEVPNLSTVLNTNRRQYFTGFATGITKLCNLVQPDVLCFGENDYQQSSIMKKMLLDLNLPLDVITVPAVREMDGLVISSHNSRLTVDERQRAPVLAKTLRWLSSQMRGGRADHQDLIMDGKDQLRAAGLEPDEIFIRDAKNLQLISDSTKKVVIIGSAILGQVRLSDNLIFDLPVAATCDSEEE